MTPEQREEHGKSLESFITELKSNKNAELVFLSPPDQRKTVRKHPGGRLEVTDGPAISSPEQPGGFYIIDADTIEEAVEWDRKGRWLVGSNEVRQIHALPS